MPLGDYYLDDYALDDRYDNIETDNTENYEEVAFKNAILQDSGSAYYEDEVTDELNLGDDEDIIYEVDSLLKNYRKAISKPIGDSYRIDKTSSESSFGVWVMISFGVVISIVTVLFVLYLAFKQRYQRLKEENEEKRQATIANQRARMAQMKQQMEAGNLIDAEALMYDSSSDDKMSPFLDHGRRDEFSM